MLIQVDPNVKALDNFLKLLGVKVNSRTIDETLHKHPDWPSLLSFSDALYKWNVPNGIGKIEPERIDELPTPFIALGNGNQPMTIISEIGKDSVTKLQTNYHRKKVLSKKEFIKSWNGSYLIADPNQESGEAEYNKVKKGYIVQLLTSLGTFVLIILLTFILINRNVTLSGVNESGKIYTQSIIMIGGLLISTMLLWYETDLTNPMLHKVCTGIKNGNCGAILASKASKVFKSISWSEIGFFYFSGGLILITFAGDKLLSALSIVALFNMAAIIYPFYSIYYQWRVAKEWCILCLIVQALLVAGAINIVLFKLINWDILTSQFIMQSVIIYSIPVFAWYMIKPYILKLQDSKHIYREFLRLKYNNKVFETLVQDQKLLTIPIEGLGIDIGNPNAKNTIVKVCNPFCGPCSKAHPEIGKLLNDLPDWKAKIIFSTPNDYNHKAINITRHLMAIAASKEQEKIVNALTDWYNEGEKKYEFFAAKYPLEESLDFQNEKIERMYSWCEQMNIEFTPTIFINDRQLPKGYNVADIRYFLLE